ncbi:MAG TPA: UPF0758 domain-containing protein [Dongiaceae bacterium]|nr:UPF0758 domain-containing protein [Dongiaceae bacterium]
MGQVLYERPREKLRSHGVRFLTLAELLQLVLGSGSAQASGAKLARKVQELVSRQQVSYDELVALNGLGEAKACQLLAAFELGRRVEVSENLGAQKNEVATQAFLEAARHQAVGSLVCYWLDGSGHEIDRKSYEIQKGEHYSLLTKRIFSDVLVTGARSIIVVIVTRNAVSMPNTYELGIMASLQETATVLGVRIIGVYAVYKKVSKKWSGPS